MIKDLKRSLAKVRISNAKRNSSILFEMPIASAAVILSSNNIDQLPVFVELSQSLNLKDSGIKIVLFKKKDENFSEFDGLTFVEGDLSILGNFNNKELLEFTQNHIDLLITFAEEDSLLLSLLTATCNAGLKVGNDTKYEKPLDVVIKSGDNAKLFASEVIKFLKQFKIKNDE